MTARHDPIVSTAQVEDVVAAIEAVDLKAPWSEVAPDLRLTLPRRRALPPGSDGLPTRQFPPGISVGLGLDIGPAMLFVGHHQLHDWKVSLRLPLDAEPEFAFDLLEQFAAADMNVLDLPLLALVDSELRQAVVLHDSMEPCAAMH